MSSRGESGNPLEPDLPDDSESTSLEGLPKEDFERSISPDVLNDSNYVESELHDEGANNPVAEEVMSEEPAKTLRQGPWMHPFPLIVGISIVGLLVALFTANLQINRLTEELGKTDYFHTPPNLSQLITRIQKSTMVVTCGESQGSGWVIALGEVIDSADEETKKIDKLYPGSVITNYHVIEDCVGARKSVTTSNGKEQYEAILFSTDKENDLAIVSTKLVLPALETSKEPKPGWWSMALGSPFGIEKSISIGNIMNVVDQQIISTAPINPGNSGGPLVNSFGEVIGTNTWKLNGADGINVAKSVQLLCSNLVACTTPFWK
jgi:S1-C subfamily serine protease